MKIDIKSLAKSLLASLVIAVLVCLALYGFIYAVAWIMYTAAVQPDRFIAGLAGIFGIAMFIALWRKAYVFLIEEKKPVKKVKKKRSKKK